MRLGVVSDIHANVHALEAALAFLSAQEVDAYLCAGDLVGYGRRPMSVFVARAPCPARAWPATMI